MSSQNPPKQRTIHFPNGTTAKVYPEYEIGPGVMSTEKPTPWQGFKLAVRRVLAGILP